MTVRKLITGKWLCELKLKSIINKRIRKHFKTKSEAQAYERYEFEQANIKPWLGNKQNDRKLSEFVDLWYSLHGCTLNDKRGRLGKLNIITKGMTDPLLKT